jgi:type II secretory pathway pseudopilin PulG
MRICGVSVKGRGGITIVELMLALMAVGILSGIAWKASTAVIALSTNSRITLEISRLNDAVEAFCSQFGDYPPDFRDSVFLAKFYKRRFPQCPPANYPDPTGQSPASALYFWLAGPKGQGFSTDPSNPFGKGGTRIGPFYKFTPDQLKKVDGVMQYFPPRGIDGAPYVYFRGGVNGYDGHPGWPPVKPYRSSTDGSWINGPTYQILCPGCDGKYGAGNHYPGGTDYDAANLDDMANFAQGSTMAQMKEDAAKDAASKPSKKR